MNWTFHCFLIVFSRWIDMHLYVPFRSVTSATYKFEDLKKLKAFRKIFEFHFYLLIKLWNSIIRFDRLNEAQAIVTEYFKIFFLFLLNHGQCLWSIFSFSLLVESQTYGISWYCVALKQIYLYNRIEKESTEKTISTEIRKKSDEKKQHNKTKKYDRWYRLIFNALVFFVFLLLFDSFESESSLLCIF